MFIEITDSKLGQGSIGFVFKGYVYPNNSQRVKFKKKMFAAVKVFFFILLNFNIYTFFFLLDELSNATKISWIIRGSSSHVIFK